MITKQYNKNLFTNKKKKLLTFIFNENTRPPRIFVFIFFSIRAKLDFSNRVSNFRKPFVYVRKS